MKILISMEDDKYIWPFKVINMKSHKIYKMNKLENDESISENMDRGVCCLVENFVN